MEARGSIIAAAGIIIAVQSGLFAVLKAGFAGIAERVDRVGREVAGVRGQPSLAFPARAGHSGSIPESMKRCP